MLGTNGDRMQRKNCSHPVIRIRLLPGGNNPGCQIAGGKAAAFAQILLCLRTGGSIAAENQLLSLL